MVEEFTNPVPALVESGQWLYNKPVKAAGRGTSQKCRQDVGQDAILPHNYHCCVQATVLRYTWE